MKRLLPVLGLLALMLGLSRANAEGRPELVLTTVPAYGSTDDFVGFVQNCPNPSQYRVTLYLQLTEGGQAWVKPSGDSPSVPLDAGGGFTLDYTSPYTQDYNAVVLHLLLIPADYTPTVNGLAEARANALDEVVVTRTSAGGVTVSPDRFRAGRRFDYAPGRSKLLVDVGFYTDGSQPGDGLSEALIVRQLDAIRPYADGVRFYAASGELSPAYRLAHDRGFLIAGNAYLSGNAAADRAELDALIEHCNRGYVSIAIVGNEALYGNKLTEEKLIEYIEYVRANVHDTRIPVTTSETLSAFDSPRLIEACDILCPNVYAYYCDVARVDAPQSFISAIEALRAKCGRKQIVVTESGYPTAGERRGGAWPGEQMAADYFEAVWAWSVQSGTPVFMFEAEDEPWKAAATQREAERHFGMMTAEGALKPAFAETGFFQSAQAGIPPNIVTFSPGEGGRTAWARGTGAGHRLTLPGCLFNPPAGREFGGWRVGDAIRQPGEVVTLDGDATVHAVWVDSMAYSIRIKALTEGGVYVFICNNTGAGGIAFVASYAADGTMLDSHRETLLLKNHTSAYTTYRLSLAQAVCVRAFVIGADGTPLARQSVEVNAGRGGGSDAPRWHLSTDVPAGREYLLIATEGDGERPALPDQRVLWLRQIPATGAQIALDDIRVPEAENATLYLIDDTGAVIRRFPCDAADVVALPEDLTEIGEEAFANTGVKHVIVPEGCAAIGPRAFAANAPMRVELPATVAQIADDAFGENVCVVAPAGSYALDWANAHGLLCR